jgi:hypothetical protein
MKKYIYFLVIVLLMLSCAKDPVPTNNGGNTGQFPVQAGEMKTPFSEDWDNWDFTAQLTDSTTITIDVFTAFSEDWDNWDFSGSGISGDIFTAFTEDWDNWRLSNGNYTIQIRTAFTEDWDNWDIDDLNSGWHCDVTTAFTEDWDNWDADDATNNTQLDLVTGFSNDFDNWDVSGDWSTSYPLEYKLAVMFVPVIVNVLLIQGLIP